MPRELKLLYGGENSGLRNKLGEMGLGGEMEKL